MAPDSLSGAIFICLFFAALPHQPLPQQHRRHAQFAGSSSVPAHVEMMGFLGMGNNPMVGATVAVAVAVEESLKG